MIWVNEVLSHINDEVSMPSKHETFDNPSISLERNSDDDMLYVQSCFVGTPDVPPPLPEDAVPPDKEFLHSILDIKIRTCRFQRTPTSRTKDPTKLIWNCEENLWTKDEEGIWNIPDCKLDTTLPTDPIVSYEATARNDNIVMNITTAPSELPVSTEHGPISIMYEEQSDTGANACITPHLDLLSDVRWFAPVTIGNAQEDSSLQVTAIGKFALHTSNGTSYINMYYSPNGSNTIVSPTAICKQSDFVGFHQWSNVKTGEGLLSFINKQNQPEYVIAMTCSNGLWFHSTEPPPISVKTVHVNALSDAAKWELWHQRLAHCGSWAMEEAHKHVTGIPPLRGNSFYKCPSCMAGKLCTKRSNTKRQRNLGTVISQQSSSDPTNDRRDTTVIDDTMNDYIDEVYLPDAKPGQHFHVDFGFVRGSEFKSKDEVTGKTVTSIDNKNSYLLIVDRKTRYMWIYTSDSKEPPLAALKTVLTKFGSDDAHRTVRTDQDKGLGKSKEFLDLLTELNFTPELTGTDNSQQNSRAERPHRDLGQMMRCLLHSASLGPEYWTYALVFAVHVKNRIPHRSLHMTPYQAFTGRKPDLSRLRIFGSRVRAKRPGRRPAKLDNHTDSGIFLGFGATDANAWFIDDATGLIKLGTHVIFDEAHMSVPARKAPLAAEALQRVGYYNREQWIDDNVRSEFKADSNGCVRTRKLTDTAITPTKGTAGSIGLDLHSDMDTVTISPGETIIFKTGIAAAPPPGCYLRVAPRSGLTVKKNINTLAGVIDPDYTGDIGVVLHNFGKSNQIIKHRERIAQLIVEKAQSPRVQECESLHNTTRGSKGFGSTDKNDPVPIQPLPCPVQPRPTAAAAAALNFDNVSQDLQFTLDLPYDISLTSSPFDTYTDRTIHLLGSHETLGLEFVDCPKYGLARLKHCKRSTPAARLTRWRSELRDGFL